MRYTYPSNRECDRSLTERSPKAETRTREAASLKNVSSMTTKLVGEAKAGGRGQEAEGYIFRN